MFVRLAVAMILALAASACDNNKSQTPPEGGGGVGPNRTPAIHKNHVLYDRFEAIAAQNSCNDDAGCFRGGCSQEVCAAEKGINTTCEALPVALPASAACGCVNNQCIWYSTDGATLPQIGSGGGGDPSPGEGATQPPPDGPACGNKTCATGEQCIEYFGIAGPRGPKFQECGIRCTAGKGAGGCPEGMDCVTIADGPGPVCRRKA